MTNINIEIPEKVHKELKIRAAMEEQPLKNIITTLLENYLKKNGGGNT